MGRETALQTRVARALRRRGAMVRKIHGSRFTVAGWPDLLCVVPPHGRSLFLETKRLGEVPTKIQLRTMQRLRRVGALAFVVNSVDEAVECYDWMTTEREGRVDAVESEEGRDELPSVQGPEEAGQR